MSRKALLFATFLAEDDDKIVEDFEIEEEESEYNFNSDENSQIDDEFDEIEHDELTSSDVEGHGVYEFDSSKLATDLVQGWGHEDYESVNDSLNSIANEVSENISENVNNIEGEDSVLETLPIALRKTCRQTKNRPNIAVSKIIGIYNFTEIVHSNISSCSADFENDFALVSNSKSIQNIFA
ncbi:22474_t:CDS:2 [Racocetra persica]|uniref:22474_t:CDS:1 n=1 Tax=Racocetra persica TaxID=160502 RepID=A0ACA9LHL2_9GLOM|nr:22474_t:CDS:2 [Racocetra persica]